MDVVTELTTERPDIPILDQITAANMADTLHKHYPNYRWAVFVSGEQGIAKVYNLDLTGQHAWVLHLDVMFSATDWDRRILRAGGEILERYRLARTRFDLDRWMSLPTDFAGRIVAAA